MELKEGMYVRTKHYNHIPSYINKIIKTTDDYVELENQKDTHYSWGKEDILKASYNIIDLIEVGDYVNGYKIEFISSYGVHIDTSLGYLGEFGFGEDADLIKIENIKSIVTKEQFESMSYKVGE